MPPELQLPLFGPDSGHAAKLACDFDAQFPSFTFADTSTPRQILGWWDSLAEVVFKLQEQASALERICDEEVAQLTGRRDTEAVRRRALAKEALRDAQTRAQEAERQAQDRFLTGQQAYHERIFSLIREAHGLDLPPDERTDYLEMFWDCLQRPLIEHFYDCTLETFVRVVFAPTSSEATDVESTEDPDTTVLAPEALASP